MAPLASTLLFATALMTSMVKGHMIMTNPVPYGKSSLNNSPLSSTGSDFPCKQRSGVYDISTMNKMAVGEDQTLSFQGSAVHGGGSCQLSVSLDTEPTKSSTFKVIKSFEGGCPGADGGPSTFKFSIPKGFPNGKATFAWTWFNRIGNREMYMNCAPITVTGGSDSKDEYNKLPDMFVANVPQGSSCSTKESGDVIFPNPGQTVQKIGSGPFYAAVGSNCQSYGKAGSGSSDSPGASGSSPAVMAPGASSAAATTPTKSTLATVYTQTTPAANANNTPVVVNTPGGAVNTPGATPAASTPLSSGSSSCSSNGAIVCNGTDKFGICNNGQVAWQSVAPGTKCSNGSISKV
ncbi:hypothetical protein HDK77DRAFT_425327 [Phyllosticta capitalensis]